MLAPAEHARLTEFAKEIRKKTLYTIGNLGVGHIGGALSIAEVLALLYGKVMRIDPNNPQWEDRDFFILSKGHAGPALYATLALKGYFPLSELDTLNRGGTNLPSHCDHLRTKGIDVTTGSLGQGLSVGCGVAYSLLHDGKQQYVYVVIGDGESQEGQIWEAAMFAAHYKLRNMIVFTDYNKLQLDGKIDDVMSLGDLAEKWRSFGWDTRQVDGHDLNAIHEAVINAQNQQTRPAMIILDTIKGKGAAFCEGLESNHNMSFSMETAKQAIAELG
ncbi:MAG: transketolase [Sphaerochaeta sp.]|nr:MAG: transketolase [Sphaerochaeta sp.]